MRPGAQQHPDTQRRARRRYWHARALRPPCSPRRRRAPTARRADASHPRRSLHPWPAPARVNRGAPRRRSQRRARSRGRGAPSRSSGHEATRPRARAHHRRSSHAKAGGAPRAPSRAERPQRLGARRIEHEIRRPVGRRAIVTYEERVADRACDVRLERDHLCVRRRDRQLQPRRRAVTMRRDVDGLSSPCPSDVCACSPSSRECRSLR